MKDVIFIAHRKSYTLLECLLALLIICSSVTLVLLSINNLKNLKMDETYNLQDEIGIYQMQITLAKGIIDEVDDNCLTYTSYTSDCKISLVNNRVISQPGTLIYLLEVDEVLFEEDDDVIYIIYTREEKEYKYPIAIR